MKNESFKILVTSVGSLVGQNILDAIEFPGFNRRHLVTIIGTNSLINSQNNYRCDRCYFVQNTSTPGFKAQFTDILDRENPDLILCGRDEDTEITSLIMQDNPHLKSRLSFGSLEAARYALNKWKTWEFVQKHDLPFAKTFAIDESNGLDELRSFIEEVGYPMISKPAQGFASKGVFFIRNWSEAEHFASYDDYIFQEYLGTSTAMDKYFNMLDKAPPLFAHAPNIFHYSCHTVISPNGEIDSIFISRNEHNAGATIEFSRVEEEELETLAYAYANAIYLEGGYGPLTVQFKKDKHDNWKAQEINLRTNGNTYPRLIMGQDDIGLIMNGLFPHIDFPKYEAPIEASEYIISKTLQCHVMHPKALAHFEHNHYWESAEKE